jgi:hypothetical protein
MLWEVTCFKHCLFGPEILSDTQWVMMIAIDLSTNTRTSTNAGSVFVQKYSLYRTENS